MFFTILIFLGIIVTIHVTKDPIIEIIDSVLFNKRSDYSKMISHIEDISYKIEDYYDQLNDASLDKADIACINKKIEFQKTILNSLLNIDLPEMNRR